MGRSQQMGCGERWVTMFKTKTNQVCLHRVDVHFLETSSLTGENVEAPFLLAARAILLAIESGTLDPEKAGSGVSYGDRALRRVNSSSRLSFGSHQSGSRRRGNIRLRAKNWIPGSKCC